MSSGSNSSLPLASLEVLASLAQHRLLATDQVRRIHDLGCGPRWVQQVLARLRRAGLVDSLKPPRRAARVWFATPKGVDAARSARLLEGEVPRIGVQEAASQLQVHTLAVNEAAICFLQAARERGDEFGPLAWRHEVFHPLKVGRGRHRRGLCADALLTYLRGEQDRLALEQRFLELDRATLPLDRLAAELGRYAELFLAADEAGEPIWRGRYPRFPAVACVLTGGRREALERRRTGVLALLRADPQLSRTPEVKISVCLLEDLRREGPFAPVFRGLRAKQGPVDWRGRSKEEAGR